MKRCLLVLLLPLFVLASPAEEYLALLKSNRYVEFTGKIAGIVKSSSSTTVLLQEGTLTNCVKLGSPANLDIGKEVRMLLKPLGDGRYELVMAIDASEIKETPPEAQSTQPSYFLYFPVSQSSRGNLTSRSLPIQIPYDIVQAYKRAVLYFNPRLKDSDAELIAKAILYFSVENNLDPRLVVAVIAVESGFNPSAVSRKGAMGLGQLMPVNVRGMGVKNPFDPLENLSASIRLIRGHLEQFEGHPQQLALALACYNAGSGAVRRYGGVPPYKETQNYIRKVTELYRKICGY